MHIVLDDTDRIIVSSEQPDFLDEKGNFLTFRVVQDGDSGSYVVVSKYLSLSGGGQEFWLMLWRGNLQTCMERFSTLVLNTEEDIVQKQQKILENGLFN